MGLITQQQSTYDTAARIRVIQLLQSGVTRKDFSNMTMSPDAGGDDASSTRVLKRSKRMTWRDFSKPLCKIGKSSRVKLGMLDGVPGVSMFTIFAKGGLESVETDFLNCDDIPFDEIKEMLADGFSKLSGKQIFPGGLAENYWGINRNAGLLYGNRDLLLGNRDLLLGNQELLFGNRGLLLGNRNLLLANQGLLLANTGLLMGIAFMLMIINSKMDRNYEAILRVEVKVDRNYDAIRKLESKVDRNLQVMLSGFNNLGNMIERGFKEVVDFVRQTKIEAVTSELITFIRHFLQEKADIRNLTHDQYITKLEEVNGFLHRLQKSRVPQSGSLHTLLYNIINQRFAIPNSSDDKIAFTALGLLCSGTEIYISVMSVLLEEYNYLANFNYQRHDLEKYNYYISLTSTTFNDFKNTLYSNNGLINEVINTLNEVKSYGFIKDEREDVIEFASSKIDDFNLVKSDLAAINNLSEEKPTEKIRYNFLNSQVQTPIGKWEDGRKVSYAIQFQSSGAIYQVGEWSTPSKVYRKANPIIDIGTGMEGKGRLIFRKFNNDEPELVGIIEDSTKHEFRDINRDFYNSASDPNESLALDEIKVFLENGADIHARYERGRQAVHAAAESGNSNVVLTLINKGADINARDENGYSPIHVAAELGYENLIKDLLANGASINAKTNLGWTALHIAAKKGYSGTVVNLMQSETIDINAKTTDGLTPIHVAASFGKTNVIISLSRDNRTDINAQSEVGFTPLHLASIGEYSDAVGVLLASSNTDVNAKTKSALTALHFASLIGNLGVAKLLLGHKDVNVNEKSADGWTALHLAIDSGKENVALELISSDNIEINAKGKDDLTPLHIASFSGQKTIVSKLLDKSAAVEDLDKYDYTPFHFAIESGNLDVVKYLAERDANIYAERKDGYTPLALAASNNKLHIVQFLVDIKRIDVNVKNRNGMTAVNFAASNGHFDIVEFLVDTGADEGFLLHWAAYGGNLNIVRYLVDEKKFDCNKKDKYENIPIHAAALQGHLNVIKYFIDEKKVNLNAKNKADYTPFLFAVLGGHLNVIKYFVNDKTDNLNFSYYTSDNNGSTALHLAALTTNLGVIKYLIRKGFDLHDTDNYGNTPLFLATSRGHLDMVKYLTQKGADFQIANNYGNTQLHFAAWNKHLNVTRYFVEKEADYSVTNKLGDTPLHVAASVDNIEYLIDKGANLWAIDYDGNNLLHFAAFNGQLHIVEYLVDEKGADLNVRNNDGNTVLHLATLNGHLRIVQYLIDEKGADLNARNNDGNTLLHLAVLNNHSSIVKYLINENGADINTKNKDGNTILHLAASNGNLNMVKYLIGERKDNINVKDRDGNVPLLKASMNNKWDVVKFLIEEHADSQIINNDGWTLLHTSVSSNNLEMLKLVLGDEDGFYTSTTPSYPIADRRTLDTENLDLNAVDKHGQTPLHIAARKGNLDIVLYLINRGADTNIKDINDKKPLDVSDDVSAGSGWTPLHYAAKYDNLEAASLFINRGANTNEEDSTDDGKKPIHIAAQEGHKNIVELFFSKGIGVDETEKNGCTPLHYAAKYGKLEVSTFLVDKGANINAQDTSDGGKKPIHAAVQEGQLDIVKYLIDKGANVHAIDNEGYTLLHLAAKRGHLNVVKYLKEEKDMYIDVKATSYDVIPLHLAAENGHLDTVKYFTEKGATLHASGGVYGYTPLHFAAENGHLDIVIYLIEKGADLHLKSKYGYIPLHFAAEYGHLDTVRFLIEKGSNVNATKENKYDTRSGINNYYTPLHLAAYEGKLNAVKFLIEKGANVDAISKEYHMHIWDDYNRLIFRSPGYYVARDRNPLHRAALNGHLNVVKHLVQKGAAFNAYGSEHYEETPLHLAAQNGHLYVVKYFIEKGVDINSLNKDGNTARDLANRSNNVNIVKILENAQLNLNLLNAVRQGNLGEVKEHVNKGASLYVKGKDGNTLLSLATRHNDILLFIKQAHQLNLDLHGAVEKGNLDLAKECVSRGVSLEGKSKNDETPVYKAVRYRNLDIIQYLVETGADVNSANKYGWTSLHLAAYQGRLEVVKYLTSKGADLYATNYDSDTPLHLATAEGHIKVKRFLEKIQLDQNLINVVKEGNLDRVKEYVKKGASLYAKDKIGKTAVDLAPQTSDIGLFLRNTHQLNLSLFSEIEKGNLGMVQEYVSKGANLEAKNEEGESPLHVAAFHDKLDIVKYLVEAGADLNATNKNSETPIYEAAYMCHYNILKYLAEKGADLNVTSARGNIIGYTLLHEMASCGNFDLFEYLVEKGGVILNSTSDVSTLLRSAVFGANLEIVKYLMEKGVDLNFYDNVYVLLYGAVLSGSLEVIKYIEEKGANLNTANKAGETIPLLCIAAVRNNADIVTYLLGRGADVNARCGNRFKRLVTLLETVDDANARSSSGKSRLEVVVKKFMERTDFNHGAQSTRRRRHNQHHSDLHQELKAEGQRIFFGSIGAQSSIAKEATKSFQSGRIGYNKGSEPTKPYSWENIFNSTVRRVSQYIYFPFRLGINLKQSQPSNNIAVLNTDLNGALLLIDLCIRKITGQKFVPTNSESLSEQEALSYALNIEKLFEKVVEQAARDSKISVHRLDIDFMKVHEDITRKVTAGQFDEISSVLHSYVEMACPGREARCPGKLSTKKFLKFMNICNNKLHMSVNQSMQEILLNESKLKPNNANEQHMNLVTQNLNNYIDNISTSRNLTQARNLKTVE